MTTVVVAGALANKPGNGGEAWVRMSWARGLARLGFDVWFVETLAEPLAADPEARDRASRFFREVTAANGFADRRALRIDGRVAGISDAEWDDLGDECDLLVNISGHLGRDPWFDRIPHRVYVDLDPGYTQIWDAQGLLGTRIADHTHHYSVGLNLGTAECSIPTGDVAWRPVLQPVVLEDWGVGETRSDTAGDPGDADSGGRTEDLRFTTIASWRGAFGPLNHDGRTYGVKAHEWRRFRALPTLARPHRFEAALAIHPSDIDDRKALERAGWALEDPAARAGSPGAYREYVTESDAEFSVAQGIYVDTASGWFSDRTARYLASGRPALVQDTGFGRVIPADEGILTFTTLGEAVEGVKAIARDYDRHARAARRLAETRFDADIVLGGMLEDLDLCP
ncbi:MAG: hypothetical protein R3195_03435 [Gemmatimonadota bacterium]|nr:hypothetical protein [Gemmatimonadota bacterium]